jgi:hypothetical protein
MPGILEQEKEEESRHVSCGLTAGDIRDSIKCFRRTSVACVTDPQSWLHFGYHVSWQDVCQNALNTLEWNMVS